MAEFPNGYYYQWVPGSNEWIHIVLNYIGPNDGIRIYHDGRNVVNITELSTRPGGPYTGNENIVLGRIYNEKDAWYLGVQVDELYFFNRTVTEAEIRMLSESTS